MAPKPAPGRTMMPLVPALVVLGLVAGAHGDSKPVFIKVPEDQTGLSGGVASFVCQATGEPKPRITWMKKGKKVSSQRFEVIEFDDGAGSVLRIQPLRVQRDEAIYECTATNSLGEINTSAKLSVLEEEQLPPGFPSIDMGPQLKVVEKARTATMLCAAGGNPDPEISWFKDFLPVDPATSNGRIKQLRSGGSPIRGKNAVRASRHATPPTAVTTTPSRPVRSVTSPIPIPTPPASSSPALAPRHHRPPHASTLSHPLLWTHPLQVWVVEIL
uniref:Protein tyrosine phosphatase receptor type F n=1 Tax=Sus scrofa TaxID=9823 RepID=A0A8D0TWH0_PIG